MSTLGTSICDCYNVNLWKCNSHVTEWTVSFYPAELEAHFRRVVKNAARNARQNYLGEAPSSQSDDGDSIAGSKKRKTVKGKGSNTAKSVQDMIATVINMLNRQEQRLVRIEAKLEDLDDDVATLRARNIRTRAGKFILGL